MGLRKISLSDAIVPSDQCVANVSFFWWLIIVLAVVLWMIRAIRVFYHLFHYWNIKAFFNLALKIQDVSKAPSYLSAVWAGLHCDQ